MTINRYKPNETIVKQGDPGDSFFYILTGTVNIRLTYNIDTGLTSNEKKKNDLNDEENIENKNDQNQNEKKDDEINVIKVDKILVF